MPNSSERSEIASLYALKAICALFVVMIHVSFLGKAYVLPLTKCAVPCFLMISGYLLYDREISVMRSRMKRWLLKTSILVIVTNTIYGIVAYMGGRVIRFIDIAFVFITGTSICLPLWYLTAFALCLLVLLLVCRRSTRCFFIFPWCILICLLLARYSFIFGQDWECPFGLRTNALTVALPCVSIGYLIRRYQGRIMPLAWVRYAPLLIIVPIYIEEFVLSTFFVNNGMSYGIFTIPQAFLLVLWCVTFPDKYCPILKQIGKYHSANIYYIHSLVGMVIAKSLPPSPPWISTCIWGMGAWLVFLLSWCVSILLLRLKSDGLLRS